MTVPAECFAETKGMIAKLEGSATPEAVLDSFEGHGGTWVLDALLGTGEVSVDADGNLVANDEAIEAATAAALMRLAAEVASRRIRVTVKDALVTVTSLEAADEPGDPDWVDEPVELDEQPLEPAPEGVDGDVPSVDGQPEVEGDDA